jgi:hypothetical protein
LAWLALIGWRMTAIPPGRFTIITISGFINLAVVLRVVFTGRRAA